MFSSLIPPESGENKYVQVIDNLNGRAACKPSGNVWLFAKSYQQHLLDSVFHSYLSIQSAHNY